MIPSSRKQGESDQKPNRGRDPRQRPAYRPSQPHHEGRPPSREGSRHSGRASTDYLDVPPGQAPSLFPPSFDRTSDGPELMGRQSPVEGPPAPSRAQSRPRSTNPFASINTAPKIFHNTPPVDRHQGFGRERPVLEYEPPFEDQPDFQHQRDFQHQPRRGHVQYFGRGPRYVPEPYFENGPRYVPYEPEPRYEQSPQFENGPRYEQSPHSSFQRSPDFPNRKRRRNSRSVSPVAQMDRDRREDPRHQRDNSRDGSRDHPRGDSGERFKNLQAKLKQTAQSNRKISDDNRNLKTVNKGLQSEIRNLCAQLAEKENAIAEVKCNYERLLKETEQMQVTANERPIDSLQSDESPNKDRQQISYQELKATIEGLERSTEELNNENEELKRQLASANGDLEESKKQVQSMEQANSDLESKLKQSLKNNKEDAERLQKYLTERDKYKEERDTYKEQLTSAEINLQKSRNSAKTRQIENERSAEQLKEKGAKIDQLTVQIASLDSNIEKLVSELEEQKATLQKTKAEHEQALKDLQEEHQKELDAQKVLLDAQVNTNKNLMEKNSLLQNQLEQREASKKSAGIDPKLFNDLKVAQKKLTEMLKQQDKAIKAKDLEIKSLEEERDNYKKQFEAAKTQCNHLKAKQQVSAEQIKVLAKDSSNSMDVYKKERERADKAENKLHELYKSLYANRVDVSTDTHDLPPILEPMNSLSSTIPMPPFITSPTSIGQSMPPFITSPTSIGRQSSSSNVRQQQTSSNFVQQPSRNIQTTYSVGNIQTMMRQTMIQQQRMQQGMQQTGQQIPSNPPQYNYINIPSYDPMNIQQRRPSR